jgi:hypothetical protein
MKTLIIITGVSLLGAVSLLIKGCRDGKSKEPKDGTVISYQDDDSDEFSPENLDVDRCLERLSLRNKLKEIEAERDMD